VGSPWRGGQVRGPPAWPGARRLRGESYRFRADHLPVGGAYGVDLWRPEEVVRDSFTLTVPPEAAHGTYVVRARMVTHAHYPNYRLRDFFFEDDYLSGLAVDTLVVRRAARDGGR
jgi:hypothetical protein